MIFVLCHRAVSAPVALPALPSFLGKSLYRYNSSKRFCSLEREALRFEHL